MDNGEQLIQASIPFLEEIKNRTPGEAMERWLNTTRGPPSALHQALSRLIKLGVEEGRAANPGGRRAELPPQLILSPAPETAWFSITAVYMNSADARAFDHPEGGRAIRGQFHSHPYGEINLVAPLDPGAELRGPNGWQGAGWTAPDPGSRHFPETRGGALIALFYLPAGRIAYDVRPSAEPPLP
jgi:hypothetical protein